MTTLTARIGLSSRSWFTLPAVAIPVAAQVGLVYTLVNTFLEMVGASLFSGLMAGAALILPRLLASAPAEALAPPMPPSQAFQWARKAVLAGWLFKFGMVLFASWMGAQHTSFHWEAQAQRLLCEPFEFTGVLLWLAARNQLPSKSPFARAALVMLAAMLSVLPGGVYVLALLVGWAGLSIGKTWSFISLSTFTLSGRGTCWGVENPAECSDFSHLINQVVLIDGAPHRVQGVERQAHVAPWRAGELISLLATPL